MYPEGKEEEVPLKGQTISFLLKQCPWTQAFKKKKADFPLPTACPKGL
jgi:hypothetical protein